MESAWSGEAKRMSITKGRQHHRHMEFKGYPLEAGYSGVVVVVIAGVQVEAFAPLRNARLS